ncbi:hypothetical protein BDV37DRAFT_270397 [Aspergillus pseudonomiae]|uniref:Peptidase M20 domain-containing protein 2 n=1 Tax=Aspergillus pseudonomiae TaxID=1506151 RepID=A0A5N7DHQ0_9EURO|nr:uncharacterized protein BDV37DRAFT_270397 [Aspergillus pseudonomiae]KAE8405937.1 hypothetical protein BDV37DRAFT_270397 [Aspergillus pseudonomiae]
MAIEQASKRLAEANRRENPELAYKKHIAHDTLCEILEENRFKVTRHAYRLDTFFEAKFGLREREIVFCAEYNALPNIRHAYGHNLIGIMSLTAFLASVAVLKTISQPGRIRIVNTPAEEHGGGKLDLLYAGAFEGADAALISYPIPYYYYYNTHGAVRAAGARLVAKQSKVAHYLRRTVYPAANPWNRANTLDVVITRYNNIFLLYQQLHLDQKIHCTILDTPKRTNIIAAPKINNLYKLSSWLCAYLEVGDLATGYKLDLKNKSAYSNLLVNDTLCGLYHDHIASYNNVSYVLPGIHAIFCIPVREKDVVTHHVSFTNATGMEEVFKIYLTVGKNLALCTLDLLQDNLKYEAIVVDWKIAKAELR